MLSKILYFTLFISFISCSDKDHSINETFKFDEKYIFHKIETLSIPLDSLVYTGSARFQYFEENSKRYLALNNPKKNTIYIYDFETKKNIQKIVLPSEGSKGVGQMDGFFIHTLDSIFVPSTNRQAMYMVNNKGDIIEKYKYNLKNENDIIQIFFSTYNTPFFYKNMLYCISHPVGNKENSSTIQCVDLATKKWTSLMPMPQKYKNNFYGAPNFYNPYGTFNVQKNHLYMSFPIENNIYELDLKDNRQINEYYGGSKYLKDVKPMGKNIFKVLFAKSSRYFIQSPSYAAIFYDKYRDLYYRIAQKPIPDNLINSKNRLEKGTKNFSIIILDNKFKKVGEIVLPPYTYAWQCIIPIKEGVLIKNFKPKNDDKDNEDNDYFDLFEVVENKK